MEVLENFTKLLALLSTPMGVTYAELEGELGLCRRQVHRLLSWIEGEQFEIFRRIQDDGTHRLMLVGIPGELAALVMAADEEEV